MTVSQIRARTMAYVLMESIHIPVIVLMGS